jgi:hypothetical protein
MVNVIKILTIGGKYLWEESDGLSIEADILEPNGIYIVDTPNCIFHSSRQTYYLCKVDIHKTALNEFYNWNEISITDEETFCWKSYTQLMDNDKNTWLSIPDTVMIGDMKVSTILDIILS